MHLGKLACPKTSKEIYRGQVAASDHYTTGGGSNYMCLPDDPEYHPNSPNKVLSATIFRVFYDIEDDIDKVPNVQMQSVPCSVCESNQRLTQLMLPAKTRCPSSDWVLEYTGYLMAAPTQYTNAVLMKGEYYRTSYSGFGLYLTKADRVKGGKLGTCPPYDVNKAVACVVCTK